ncbi:hypothetical protein Tco_1254215 [Tanacetum coccineum]
MSYPTSCTACTDSRLEIIEQFLNNFANHPNETNMNDLEFDDELVDTPIVSPFPHSDNDSDVGEVLNELIEYKNVGMLRREKAINSFDGDDLAFQLSRAKAYNTIMVEGLGSTGKNLVAVVRDVYVFVGRKAHLLEDKQIPSVGVFDEVFRTWMAFEGNTRDLGSFGEETDEITDLHQIHEEILFLERGDGVAGIKRRRRDPSSDGVRYLVTASGCGRLNKDL